MDGILVLNKPAGFTSFDCIAIVKGVSKQKKVGHTGTLDPNATGILPICFGRATKLIEYMDISSKTYVAEGVLGKVTDTQDIWGRVTEEHPLPAGGVPRQLFAECLNGFSGEIMQIPPAFSAVHINGVKAYKLAQQGVEARPEPRKAVVYSIELLSYDEGTGQFSISVCCGRGTYIRTIIHDLGQKLGPGAVMTGLKRVSACGFTEADALDLDTVRTMDPETLKTVLFPLGRALSNLPKYTLEEDNIKAYLNGMTVCINTADLPEDQPLAVLYNGELLGISRIEGNYLKPVKIFPELQDRLNNE